MKRAARWLIIGAISVVALVVGGTFVYIHFIEGDPPAPLSIGTVTSDASNTTNATNGASTTSEASGRSDDSSVEGTWQPTADSIAGYRVKEKLFGQSATAVGRTSDVTGKLVIDNERVTDASFTVDMTTVKSDRDQRDNQFQGRIMDTSTYPTSTFELASPIALGTIPADGKVVTYKATGKLTLHGTTKTVTVDLDAKRAGDNIDVSGSIPITFAEWNIPNPSFGPASTEDHGELEFLLVFAK
jgi:polyisoprenoid-binding protein YceI